MSKFLLYFQISAERDTKMTDEASETPPLPPTHRLFLSREELFTTALAGAYGERVRRNIRVEQMLRDFRVQQATRFRMGEPQASFARRHGISPAFVSQMENPKEQHPSVRMMLRYAEMLDVALDVRFVSFEDFARIFEDPTRSDYVPLSYNQKRFEAFLAGDGAPRRAAR